MNLYQFIIFDYDGCLADSVKPWVEAIGQASSEFGLNLTKRDIAAQFGDLERVVVYQGLPQDKVMAYKDRVISLAMPKVAVAPLYEGAKELLSALKKHGKTLAIVSGNAAGLHEPLKSNRIDGYFDVVVSGADVTNKKPNPEGIELALKKMGADKKRAVMIGDTEHDLGAAKNAGIDSIFFCHPDRFMPYDKEEISGLNPKYTVSSHKDLLELLLSPRART